MKADNTSRGYGISLYLSLNVLSFRSKFVAGEVGAGAERCGLNMCSGVASARHNHHPEGAYR